MSPREVAFSVPRGALAGLRHERPGRPRVIALHGWLDNAASFLPLLPHLDGLDLLLLDLPGHGRSAHLPPGADYRLDTHLHATLDAADALGWDRFALLGHSMGAAVAALVAAAVPARVERLALIETLGPLSESPPGTVARLREGVAGARALAGKSLRVFPDLAVAVRARMQASQLDEANARLLVERGTRAVPGGHVWSSDPRLTVPAPLRLAEEQVLALLAAIACPVHVLYADPAQPYFPEDRRRARLAALPGARLTVLPGGHHLHMDQPAAVAAALGGFLAGA
ncbi:MAG TPA: alpha/beta hydrolase [Pseudoxanthomonas sp.]|nr:alpha/beta hydrolase [Pseudoxanthomonas sp.]